MAKKMDEKNNITVEENAQDILRMGDAIFHKRSTHAAEVDGSLKNNPDVIEEFGLNSSWGYLYDVPYMEILVTLADIVGLKDEFKSKLSGDVSLVEFVRLFTQRIEEIEAELELDDFEVDLEWMRFMFGCMYVVQSNYQCKIKHGKYIQELLIETLKDGNNVSFFTAVQIDSALLNSQIGGRITAAAKIAGDAEFSKKLSRAIEGKFKTKNLLPEDVELREMLIYERDLVEGGDMEKFTSDEAYEFYVEDRQLYGDDDSDSYEAFKRLRHRCFERLKQVKDGQY